MGSFDPSLSAEGPPRAVRWLQVAGLALLHTAMGLSWLVYVLYLPALIISLGLDPRVAITMLMVEGLLAIALEPLFGFLSDRFFRRVGTRLPFVVTGVFLAAALFIVIPVAASTSLVVTETGRALFLVLLAGWAIAMTVFRAPALSLLSRYATTPNLPRAASLLTLLGAGVGALRPISRDVLLSPGPVVCFGTGALFLLAACAIVWRIDRQVPTASTPARVDSPGLFGPIATLLATGAGVALTSFAFFTHLLPRLFGMLPREAPGPGALQSGALLFFGVSALAAGLVAKRIGNGTTMLVGAGTAALFIVVLAISSPAAPVLVALIAITVAAFAFVANGVIPLALDRMSAGHAGLGLGCYFGALAATSSIAASRFRAPIGVAEASALALIGLAVVAAAVWVGQVPAAARRNPPLRS